MSGHHMTPEEYKSGVKAVWVTTALLTVITIVEVTVALMWPYGWSKLVLNLLLTFMGLAKAFWIMGEFMHLKYEVRSLILSILVPCLFLIWFIIALLYEGNAWMSVRQYWGGM